MLIGYARISKADGSQSLDLQRDALREAEAPLPRLRLKAAGMTERFPFGPASTARKNPTTKPIHPLSLVNSHVCRIGPQPSRARSGAANP